MRLVADDPTMQIEDMRRNLATFLSLHAQKACKTTDRVVFLQYYSDTMPIDMPLLVFDQNDVLTELDKESELVRWLLNQMRTYNPDCQRVVGLIFDKQHVLSEVLYDAPHQKEQQPDPK